MNAVGIAAGMAAVGATLALAAFAVLHGAYMPVEALIAGAIAAGVVLAVRYPWAHLPTFIGLWLDLGVAVATTLFASVAHALTFGIAFTILRGPELILLFGAGLLVALAASGLTYTHLRLANEVEGQAKRVAELERSALTNRLSMLSAQINPHFLFNTLNTIAEVVHEDEDAAEELVTDLAAMMRTTLRGTTGPVPLVDELALVRRLLRIEAARLGDRLVWTLEGEETLASTRVRVPGLLIQPLVENAVKYAAANRAEGGEVHISVSVEDHVRVRIRDTGPGLPTDVAEELASGTLAMRGTEGHGGGLRNCVERLRLTWPNGNAKLLHEVDVPGTCLILELPIEGAVQ